MLLSERKRLETEPGLTDDVELRGRIQRMKNTAGTGNHKIMQ